MLSNRLIKYLNFTHQNRSKVVENLRYTVNQIICHLMSLTKIKYFTNTANTIRRRWAPADTDQPTRTLCSNQSLSLLWSQTMQIKRPHRNLCSFICVFSCTAVMFQTFLDFYESKYVKPKHGPSLTLTVFVVFSFCQKWHQLVDYRDYSNILL